MQVINDIRNRTGARVNLFDEEKSCGDRMLQVRHRCAAVVKTLWCASQPFVRIWSVALASAALAGVAKTHISYGIDS
jgi:hypothetical protein